jgi:hypothetical protein
VTSTVGSCRDVVGSKGPVLIGVVTNGKEDVGFNQSDWEGRVSTAGGERERDRVFYSFGDEWSGALLRLPNGYGLGPGGKA